MVNISDRTVSSVIGVPSPNTNTNDFGWAGGGTRVDGVIPPTPEPSLTNKFVAISSGNLSAYSSDGVSWDYLPNTFTNESGTVSWTDIAFGQVQQIVI